MRSILWMQGYATRINVPLAYPVHPRDPSRRGLSDLTDLDVLGVRLTPEFRVQVVIADCKTVSGGVSERMFWLHGLRQFFASDIAYLVRSQSLSAQSIPMSRELEIGLIGAEDLAILQNIHGVPSQDNDKTWSGFFSPNTIDAVTESLSSIPRSLTAVRRYRDAGYWMEPARLRLMRVISALSSMKEDGWSGDAAQAVFSDFVSLYVLAIWQACQSIVTGGISQPERGLELYLNGDEGTLRNANLARQSIENLLRLKYELAEPLPSITRPTYFPELLDLVVRFLRRPEASTRVARHAEWVLVAQHTSNLGPPPWSQDREDEIARKLLGDVALFLSRSAKLADEFLDTYLARLSEKMPDPESTTS